VSPEHGFGGKDGPDPHVEGAKSHGGKGKNAGDDE
jgi:hypothetical protein